MCRMSMWGIPVSCQWGEPVRLCWRCGAVTCCGTKAYVHVRQEGKLEGLGPGIEWDPRDKVEHRFGCLWEVISGHRGNWLTGGRVGPVCLAGTQMASVWSPACCCCGQDAESKSKLAIL